MRIVNFGQRMATLFIETDLESDDVLALYRNTLRKANYYVVGEGDPKIKYNRMKRYCKLLGNNDAVVIQGLGSKKPFPNDGKEFDSLETNSCNEGYMDHFKQFATASDPVMFSLKPMRELVKEYAENKEQVKGLVKNVTLYVYGGFNFRCLVREYGKELIELLYCFKKVSIYESHYATGENSVNKQNSPLLYKYCQEHKDDPYIQTLLRLINIWNCHLRDEMKETLETKTEPNDIKRLHKIICDIEGNEDFQFVLADFALTSVYDKVEPHPIKNLRFDENGRTKFDDVTDPEEPVTIYAYKGLDFGTVEKHVVEGIDC